jgi:biopolymer transport protein ExbD
MKALILLLAVASLAGCATVDLQSTVDVVQIDANGISHLNGKRVPVASLSDSFTHDAVVIEVDPASRHADLVAVLEEAKEAGIVNVSLKAQNETK